jgi:hypothetical protein
MSRIIRGTALACYLGIALLSSGCAEDNDKTANLGKGTAPTDGKTDKERYDAMKNAGAGAGISKGYPGASKK